MENPEKPNVIFHSIISSIQKIALYETKSRFYLIGSNNTLTRFRVLKIDRTEPKELIVTDDKVEYTQEEIADLVNMIDMGNRTKSNQRAKTTSLGRIVSAFGIVGSSTSQEFKNIHKPTQTNFKKSFSNSKLVSAFGLVGFIRFLEGYYIILATKRRRVAVIGYHTIYKIEDTAMIYIPNDTVRIFHQDEQRYVKMFQSIDLSSNFYFSYSYDHTHTLQYNLTPPKHIKSQNTETTDSEISEECFNMWSSKRNWCENGFGGRNSEYGIRNNPHRRFVWNDHLLKPVEKDLHRDWVLYITHGFIGQSNVSIFGKSIYITLIARRSNKYAGTRFLKRGATFDGDVANEVETEQIVYDSGVSSLHSGHFTSFVQMRGSVPSHWSQDISKMVPKPTISSDLADPYFETAGGHFNNLLRRYGAPIIILNLVKKREKKKHESILSDELYSAIRYLNQFLSPEFSINYISFDMARMNKGKKAKVMSRLANIANNAVIKTGIYQSVKSHWNSNKANEQLTSVLNKLIKPNDIFVQNGTYQTGIIRTNCVDCLDRTNTAQFAIGKCALGYQLCSLGVLDSPKLEFDSDCVRMLEELYEDHGDILALQYGGSQLVHRIKTYRKTAPWTSQGNDIMQTLSRYYSNTFSDQEKQQTINLFLGLFVPEEGKPPIWEYLTDYYFHHKLAVKYERRTRVLTQWWDKNVQRCLPFACSEMEKTCDEMFQVQDCQQEMVDIFYDYHRPFELIPLSELYAYKISHSIRDFMPHFTTNFSPFAVRVRPGRRREETGSKRANMKNPSMTGQSSTSSTASSASSSMDSSSDDDTYSHQVDSSKIIPLKDPDYVSFESLFPSMKQIYGTQLENPKRSDLVLYKRFVMIGRNASQFRDQSKVRAKMVQQVAFPETPPVKVLLPFVKNESLQIYREYVERGTFEGLKSAPKDIHIYEKYLNENLLIDTKV